MKHSQGFSSSNITALNRTEWSMWWFPSHIPRSQHHKSNERQM